MPAATAPAIKLRQGRAAAKPNSVFVNNLRAMRDVLNAAF
jgi:hypothetical protein